MALQLYGSTTLWLYGFMTLRLSADEVGEGAGVGVEAVDEASEEEEEYGDEYGGGDEPVFVVVRTEVDEEDDGDGEG